MNAGFNFGKRIPRPTAPATENFIICGVVEANVLSTTGYIVATSYRLLFILGHHAQADRGMSGILCTPLVVSSCTLNKIPHACYM
jgi:hypothetical protein